MKTMIVLGGGCYGLLHVTHLLRARDRGRIAFDRIVVVDRDATHRVARVLGSHPDIVYVRSTWEAYLVRMVCPDTAHPDDEIVPPCIGPHLALHWLEARLREIPGWTVTRIPWDGTRLGIPFERTLHTGMHAVSYALWRCPPTCIEPPMCPAIRAPKNWDVGTFLERHRSVWTVAGRVIDTAVVIVSRHRVWGVATIPVRTFLNALHRVQTRLATADGPVLRVLVATVSSCHGLLGLLEVRRAQPGDVK